MVKNNKNKNSENNNSSNSLVYGRWLAVDKNLLDVSLKQKLLLYLAAPGTD